MILVADAARVVEELGEPPGKDEAASPLPLQPENLAYVIYTSGSTGRPKGVAISHRGIVRLVKETNYLQLGPGDRVAQVANLNFDAATWEIWGALVNGAALVVIPREVALSTADLAETLRRQQANSGNWRLGI